MSTSQSQFISTDMPGSWSSSSSSPRQSISSTRSVQSNVSTAASSVEPSIDVNLPKWADEHYPLITSTNLESIPEFVPRNHSAVTFARTMAEIHNGIIRAINTSYNYSILIQPSTKEAEDFLEYNKIIAKTIDHHHHTEDDFFFPEIEKLLQKPGAMEENTKGHELFTEGLGIYEKYVNKTTSSEYNGITLRHIIESFASDLVQHLHEEIPTLLNLYILDSNKYEKLLQQAHKYAMKDSEIFVDAPFVLACQDSSFEIDGKKSTFPDMPWIISGLVRKLFARKHAGVWRFCPSDLNGNRRRMMAL